MAIPKTISIKNSNLPDEPGVYFYFDIHDKLLYVGKATSLKRRVGSYFNRTHRDSKTEQLVEKIARINYEVTDSVLEALVLEANMIRKFLPPYNIKGKDDKSFQYLCITREKFPRPLLYRGGELESIGYHLDKLGSPERRRDKRFLAIFGPFTSGYTLKNALHIIRKSIPYSTDLPPEEGKIGRPCFYYHLHQCPGVCIGAITPEDYRPYIRDLIRIMSGKKADIIRSLRAEMRQASELQEFEKAGELLRRLRSLEHIRDISLVTADRVSEPSTGERSISAFGRVEAYDISNISGTSAVGSMTVALHGEVAPREYRKFKIKTVKGANDYAMMKEVLERRFSKENRKGWGVPDLIVVDGGLGQVNAVRKVLMSYGIDIPLVGLAKGFDRKQDVLVYDRSNPELKRVAEQFKTILQRVRDEAHRFAITYHRKLRAEGIRI